MTIESLIGNTEQFPVLRKWDFFNHAGVSPFPKVVADALRTFADEAERGAYLDTAWYTDLEALRAESAALINAHRDEIAFVKNTSEGLATVAKAIDWQFGDRIITTNVEYPANIYPWMDAARRSGAKLVMVPEIEDADGERVVPVEHILEEAAKPHTRMVTLSHVEFASGQRHDLARIGEYCRNNGILFCVDAIQTLGVVPVDVKKMHIDYLSADGHKWLLAPEAAGIFYCRRELLERTRPLSIGWLNVINPLDFGNYDFTLKSDAGRFESGSYNVAGLLGLRASIKLLTGAGIDNVFDRIKVLTDRLIAGLRTKHYRVLSPRGFGQWSGIVSFATDRLPHRDIVLKLKKEHNTEIALRESRLRASAHFYNTEEQIDRLIEHLP